jgi:hydroxypyruvate isomerase
VDLHNCCTLLGDVTRGELGFAAIPGAEEKFRDSINLAVRYAKALQCSRYVLCALDIPTHDLGKQFLNSVPGKHKDAMRDS